MNTERRPFHESIVRAIRRADAEGLKNVIGPLLVETDIPKEHDAIAEAWKQRCHEIGDPPGLALMSVLASLNDQKREAEAKAAEKAKAATAS